MASTAAYAVGAVAAIALIGGAYALSTSKKATTQAPAKIVLTAASATIPVKTNDEVTAVLTDANGNAIPNYPITIYGNSIGQDTVNTDSTGSAAFEIQFPAAGTYNVWASAT